MKEDEMRRITSVAEVKNGVLGEHPTMILHV